MIKVIIFDFDGVIINEYTMHYKLSKKKTKGLTEREFKKLFEGNIHIEREKLGRDTGFDLQHHYNEYKKTVLIKPAIRKALRELSKKYILGVISSAKESGTIECIKNSGLERAFSFVYSGETHKLKTEKFKLALQKFNVSAGECIYVTDTLGDILEAKEVGIKTVALDSGYHNKKTLLKGKPLRIISELSELNDAVKNL